MIGEWWLYGNGENIEIKNNGFWDAYMRGNPEIYKEIQLMISTFVRDRTYEGKLNNGDTVNLNSEISVSLQTLERTEISLKGYDLLNSPGISFTATGTLTRNTTNNNVVVKMTYTFHDKMDLHPNDYWQDRAFTFIEKKFEGKTYDLKIIWYDESEFKTAENHPQVVLPTAISGWFSKTPEQQGDWAVIRENEYLAKYQKIIKEWVLDVGTKLPNCTHTFHPQFSATEAIKTKQNGHFYSLFSDLFKAYNVSIKKDTNISKISEGYFYVYGPHYADKKISYFPLPSSCLK